MKNFLKEIILGFLGLFIFNLIIFFSIINPQVYKPYESIMENIHSENIIFSDSHGWSLTNNIPENKKKLKRHNIVNLSYGSDSYFDIYFKLKYLIEKGVKIDTIYLSADVHMLGNTRVKSNNRDRSIAYSDYKTYTKFYEMTFIEYFIRKRVRKYLSTFDVNNSRLIQEYISSFFNPTNHLDVLLWQDLSIVERKNRSQSKFKMFYKRGFSKKLEIALNEILQLSKSNGITVVGVIYPLSIEMKTLSLPKNAERPEIILLNNGYNTLEFDFDNPIYFENQDHVNKKGAQIILNKLIKN